MPENLAHLRANAGRPDEFRLTRGEFCHTPGAKFRQFRTTATHELAASKQLAAGAWGEIRRVSPHEKKEKYFAGAKFKSETRRLAAES
jgi:hypothetical protein